jgi:hypothetical protein
MSVADALTRISEIQTNLIGPLTGRPPAADPAAFEISLARAQVAAPASPPVTPPLPQLLPLAQTMLTAPPVGAGGAGASALVFAQAEVGQAEMPPGSNDSPRIADYRAAVAGSYAGAPWCAYFVSWAAAQAGAPLGETGQGFGAVEQIADWAERTGRLLPAGSVPSPGDVILFGGRHVGIVESVNADGSLTTVEGNHASAVSRVQRSPAEATGYVRL